MVSVTHLLEGTKLLEYNPCYQKEAKDVSLVVNIYVFRRPFATEGVQTNSFFPLLWVCTHLSALELCLALAQGGKKGDN